MAKATKYPDKSKKANKRYSCPCASLIKHYTKKIYGGMEV
jgi:hypothetical protein